MQKIPLKSNPSDEPQRELAPRFLIQAIEILLLGALWLFVLVWMPFYAGQEQTDTPVAVYKVHWLTVFGLALVLLVISWMQREAFPVSRLQWLAIVLIACPSVIMLAAMSKVNPAEFAKLVCIVQALFGLVYFAVSRARSL